MFVFQTAVADRGWSTVQVSVSDQRRSAAKCLRPQNFALCKLRRFNSRTAQCTAAGLLWETCPHESGARSRSNISIENRRCQVWSINKPRVPFIRDSGFLFAVFIGLRKLDCGGRSRDLVSRVGAFVHLPFAFQVAEVSELPFLVCSRQFYFRFLSALQQG